MIYLLVFKLDQVIFIDRNLERCFIFFEQDYF
jgi:hypothetical protein